MGRRGVTGLEEAGAPYLEPPFRPSVVTTIGSWFVVLDDLQPRALVVPADDDVGAPPQLLSWSDRPRPTRLRWPWRTVTTFDDVARVADGPGSTPVALRADPVEGVVLADASGNPGLPPARGRASATFPCHQVAFAEGGLVRGDLDGHGEPPGQTESAQVSRQAAMGGYA